MRLIDADKLPVVTEWCVDEAGFGASFHVVHEEDINKAPTIDPESLRPQGEWMYDPYNSHQYCSHCRKDPDNRGRKTPYCPNCGAKMKGADNHV